MLSCTAVPGRAVQGWEGGGEFACVLLAGGGGHPWATVLGAAVQGSGRKEGEH